MKCNRSITRLMRDITTEMKEGREMPGQQHSILSERIDRSKASPVVVQSQFPWVHANLKKRLKTACRLNEAETRSERKTS